MTTPFIHPKQPISPITSLGLGVFDGLHRGHQKLLEHCDALLSISPHPAIIVKKAPPFPQITTQEELKLLITQIKPTAQLFTLNFSIEVSKLSPTQFLSLITSSINPQHIVIGYDFKFGYQQSGDISTLKSWGENHNIKITEVQPVTSYSNHPYKSSPIRQMILNNEFNTAIEWLGHPYLILGTVIKGEGRGKKMGFPTANLAVPQSKLIPSPGIYKGFSIINDKKMASAIYIGSKPTFSSQAPITIEVHIIDYQGPDLYNQAIQTHLTEKIRDDQSFDSVETLCQQIQIDIDLCRS